MSRKEINIIQVTCDWCNKDMANQKYGTFVRGLNFNQDGIDPSGSGGATIAYPDLCIECSNEFLHFIEKHKELKRGHIK